MAVIFNPQTGRYEVGPDTQSFSKKENRLSAYGQSIDPVAKPSTFETLLDLLSRPEAASASLIGGLGLGKDLGSSLSDAGQALAGNKKYSYTDVLKEAGMGDGIGTSILGFGLGTLLDPTTYIPVGKIANWGGKGLKMLPGGAKLASRAGELGRGAKALLGLKELTPEAKVVESLGKGVTSRVNFFGEGLVEKYKPLQKLIQKTDQEGFKRVVNALESPKTSLSLLKGDERKLYTELTTMYGETGKAKQALGTVKGLIEDRSKQPAQLGLPGVNTGKLGIGAPKEAEGYVNHLFTDEFKKVLLEKGGVPEEALNTLRGLARKGIGKLEKSRSVTGIIEDINKASMKKYGVNALETDLKKMVPTYLYNHSRQLALDDLAKEMRTLKTASGVPLLKMVGDNIPEGMAKLSGLGFNGYAATPEIAKIINRTTGVLTTDVVMNKFIKGFDKLQNVWKFSATSLNPSFHINNLMGASFNNFIKDAGSFSPEVIKDTVDMIRKKTIRLTASNGKTISGADFLEYLRKHGALTSFVSPDTFSDASTISKVSKAISKPGSGVENLVRTQLALSQWKKTGNLSDAVKAVWEVHGNYNPEAMSSFEREGIKRIFPFYNWAKTNIPFQIKNLINKTGKYSALARLQNSAVSPEDRANLPEYARALPLLPLNKAEDGTVSTRSLGLPIGDLNNLSTDPGETLRKMIGGGMSPFLKVPIEQMTNKNMFYDRPIVDKTLPSEMQKANAPDIFSLLPQFAKDRIGYLQTDKKSEATGKVTTKKEMNAQLAYLLSQIPPMRYGNLPKNTEAERTATGMGGSNIETIMAALTGVMNPVKPINYNQKDQDLTQKKRRDAELQARINFLIQRGIIPKLK